MAYKSKQMETLNLTSGLQEQKPLPFSVISTNGIERSIGVREMSSEHGVSQFLLIQMVLLALPMTLSTRSILKGQMARKWTETQPGQPTRYRILPPIYLIAFTGIHQQNINGSIQDQLS